MSRVERKVNRAERRVNRAERRENRVESNNEVDLKGRNKDFS